MPEMIQLVLSDKEVEALDELCKRQELSRSRILKQGLRTYQAIVCGAVRLEDNSGLRKRILD